MKTPNIAEIINNSGSPSRPERFKDAKIDLQQQLPLPTIASAMQTHTMTKTYTQTLYSNNNPGAILTGGKQFMMNNDMKNLGKTGLVEVNNSTYASNFITDQVE